MSDNEEELRQFLGTTSFGAKATAKDIDAAYERTKREVPQPDAEDHTSGNCARHQRKKENDDSDDSLEVSSDEESELPISHEIILNKHTKTVSGLTVDPSGSRLVSGSHDSQVALWDFAGMGSLHRSFKVLEPFESHQIRSVDFNSAGELLLMTASNWQPKVMTREGEEIAEMSRGDPYLRDMKNTRGHVGEVTSGSWNPKINSQCITSSSDATVRIWDALNVSKPLQILVHKAKVAGAGRVKCTTAAYSHDGKMIGSAYVDGTLSLWATDGPFHRPMGGVISDAHKSATTTTGLAFSLDGWSLASRGSDCIKLWDRRKFKEPIAVFDNLPNQLAESTILFSPNNQEILSPTSTATTAHIQVLASKTLSPLQKIPFPSPVVKIVYHAKLNQIITGLASGDIHVLYSPERSIRGAKLVVTRAPKARHVDDLLTADIDESAGEVRQDDASTSAQAIGRARNAARKDPKQSKMPDLPGTQRYAERKVIGDMVSFRDQDPQKELLKYDEAAKKDPLFFGVYKTNQPVTQYASLEDTEPATPVKKLKFTPRDKK